MFNLLSAGLAAAACLPARLLDALTVHFFSCRAKASARARSGAHPAAAAESKAKPITAR